MMVRPSCCYYDQKNAPTLAMEGTQNLEKDINKVGCVSMRMKPCDLEKHFEWNAQHFLNPSQSIISHGNLVGFLTKSL